MQHVSTKDGEEIFCQVFDTNYDLKVRALRFTNCSHLYASDFPFKIKASRLQTRQTNRKNWNNFNNYRKQKLVIIKHCSEKVTN